MRRTGGGADLSRKEFLRLGGAGLAGAALFGGEVSPEQAVQTLQSNLQQIAEEAQAAG